MYIYSHTRTTGKPTEDKQRISKVRRRRTNTSTFSRSPSQRMTANTTGSRGGGEGGGGQQGGVVPARIYVCVCALCRKHEPV